MASKQGDRSKKRQVRGGKLGGRIFVSLRQATLDALKLQSEKEGVSVSSAASAAIELGLLATDRASTLARLILSMNMGLTIRDAQKTLMSLQTALQSLNADRLATVRPGKLDPTEVWESLEKSHAEAISIQLDRETARREES